MEAMLRAGNLAGIDEVAAASDGRMIHLDGTVEGGVGGNADYAAQVLAAQAQHAATAAAAAAANRHGVRVVPTSTYDPSTGAMTASTSLSGKQKGKNQLNALLANAASLEASRLQNPHLSGPGGGAGGGQNAYRNNAKRKYGW